MFVRPSRAAICIAALSAATLVAACSSSTDSSAPVARLSVRYQRAGLSDSVVGDAALQAFCSDSAPLNLGVGAAAEDRIVLIAFADPRAPNGPGAGDTRPLLQTTLSLDVASGRRDYSDIAPGATPG